MSPATFPIYFDRRESLGGEVVLSLAMHAVLFSLALGYAVLGPRFAGGRWGQKWGIGGAVRVGAVPSLPGVPLPAPMLTTPSTLATQNPGLYKTEPKPKPEPAEKAQEIPKFKEAVKVERAERINKRIQRETLESPENAIPFGLGGKPTLTYTPLVNQAGEGGLSFGEGNFGDRYGWYVAAVRNRISSNWLLSTVSPNVFAAPRVYIEFDILRDGAITNVEIKQSSGIPEVDRSALRAVLASNPLGPLPPDYSGSKVSVQFYFDFRRR